jgi:5'-methylthioadenosine phosphorylase
MLFGIIGGTGLYQMADEGRGERLTVETDYGAVQVEHLRLGEAEVAFLARHGFDHGVPPHRVNYRGNIAALKRLGVTNILASAAVGSMTDHLPPGSFAALTQFLDFTRGRHSTFFDGDDGKVVHVDVTEPYCLHLRGELLAAADALNDSLHPDATYVCAEGPRFETPAEIRMFRQLGGEVVGMTGVPEVALAREAGMCYAAVAIVTNWAAGVSKNPIGHREVSSFMDQQAARLRTLFTRTIAHHAETECACRSWAQS